MKFRITMMLVAAMVLVIPTLVQAQQGFGPFGSGGWGGQHGYMYPGMGPGMMGPIGRGRHLMIDANDDGAVSSEEAASAADEIFTIMDADDDGTLTEEEYMARRLGPQFGYNPDRQAAQEQQKQERFKSFDADGDGVVTKEEFLASAEVHHQTADTDGDGKVTPWEHRRQNWN